jgi:hypothetical protein
MPTPRIFCNDDGWIIGTYDPPLTPDRIHEKMIAPYADTPVDTFLWSIGGHEVYDYETEIGELYGAGYDLTDPAEQRRYTNLRQLIKEHGGPVTLISELCHQAGLRFFPSVRMNEHYDIGAAAPNYGRLRRDHPELLIGRPGEELPDGGLEWGIRTGLNYAFPEVRQHMSAIICELIERFDIDGIELDFMRHPGYFRIEEAQAQGYLITDMITHIRRKIDQVSAAKGKKIELAARVPPTLYDARRIGLDAATWIRQGLVDILIGGGGFIAFETPTVEFVEAARDTDCLILGPFEALSGMLNEDQLRAVAARYWDAGVDGLYLFNYYSMSNQWRRTVLTQMADPVRLARTNKCYALSYTDRARPTSQLGYSFRNAIPHGQLPVTLAETQADRGACLTIDVNDDVQTARTDGALLTCILGLGFENLEDEDELAIHLNGTAIPWTNSHPPARPWTTTSYDPEWNKYPSRLQETPLELDAVEFDLTDLPLNKGSNQLEIRMVKTAPRRESPILLKDVRILLTYKNNE